MLHGFVSVPRNSGGRCKKCREPEPGLGGSRIRVNQALSLAERQDSPERHDLQATVTYTTGSDVEGGPATLEALGDMDGLVVLNLSGGQQQGIWNGQSGAWVGTGGT